MNFLRSSFFWIYPWNCFNKWKFQVKQVTREDNNNIPGFFLTFTEFSKSGFLNIYISCNNYIKCTQHLDRFSSFNTMVQDWRSNYHERGVGITLDHIKWFNLTLQFCTCPKPGHELSTWYIMVFFVFSGLRLEMIYILCMSITCWIPVVTNEVQCKIWPADEIYEISCQTPVGQFCFSCSTISFLPYYHWTVVQNNLVPRFLNADTPEEKMYIL